MRKKSVKKEGSKVHKSNKRKKQKKQDEDKEKEAPLSVDVINIYCTTQTIGNSHSISAKRACQRSVIQ